jgi:hypothetical protein
MKFLDKSKQTPFNQRFSSQHDKNESCFDGATREAHFLQLWRTFVKIKISIFAPNAW